MKRKILIFNLILIFPYFLAAQFSKYYTYDNLNRLTLVKINNAVAASYTYDALGNRLTKALSSGYTISGQVSYAKPSGAVSLNNFRLLLKNSEGAMVQTVSTNSTGNYEFTNVSNGIYTISAGTSIPWSPAAVTSYDLYLFQKDINGITPLAAFYRLAGDVDKNQATNPDDLSLIQQRIVGLSTDFASGDWFFDTGTITVSGSNLVKNINALMAGDADGSYSPQ